MIPNFLNAKECRVLKFSKSFSISKPNLSAALVAASLAAFLVKEKYPICLGLIPCLINSSTQFNKVVVFPVPGGPKIIVFIKNHLPDI